MKLINAILMIILCSGCSEEPELYSAKAFKSSFTNGLFISKLKKNNIPHQVENYMGQEYVLVHEKFKTDVMKLRANSATEGRLLVLINLENECSQQKLAERFKAESVHHQTVTKADIPAIRVTQKDNMSDNVTSILNEQTWRCH